MSKYSNNMPPDIAGAIGWVYERVKSGTSFLDFGCSTGYFGSFIKSKGIEVYGVEISKDRFEAGKVLDGVYSFDLDGEWPKEVYERKYDYLFFGDVLEHLKDPTLVLSKAKQLLKTKGKIFVSIPNIAHMSIPLELLAGNFIYEPMGILDNTHLQYFTLSTFTDYASKAGLDAELVDYTANDIPKEIYEKQLAKLGLRAENKFWNRLKTVEARSYQFKFILTPHSKVIDKAHKGGIDLSNKPLQYRDDILSDFRKQVTLLDEHSKKQAAIIAHFQNKSTTAEETIKVLQHELAVAKETPPHIFLKRLRGTYSRIIEWSKRR